MPSALDRIQDAWPWPERYAPASVERALRQLGNDPPIDVIVAGIVRDTRNARWCAANEKLGCAGYIRRRMYDVRPKNGSSTVRELIISPAKPSVVERDKALNADRFLHAFLADPTVDEKRKDAAKREWLGKPENGARVPPWESSGNSSFCTAHDERSGA